MLADLQNFIESEKLFNPSTDRVLLAVSGGADSVVMTELFSQTGYRFAIAHCNFGLRGKESDDDEAFCESLARRHKVMFLTRRFDTGKYAVENKMSIQAAARKLRYAFFHECLEKEKFSYAATAHHKNDVLETMLINFTRGTGIAGLHGILPKQGHLIRPMLFASRHEIETHAAMQGIAFRVDSSNSSEKYMRNKIRMRVIPILEEINPSIERTAVHVSKNLYAAEQILKNHLADVKKRTVKQKGKKVYISIRKLKELHPVKAYLFEFIREYGFNAHTIENIAEAIGEKQSGKKFISETHLLVKDRNDLIISEQKYTSEDSPEIGISKKMSRISKPLALSFKKEKVTKKFVIPPGRNTACLDLNQLKFPLTLRKWNFGEWFIPLGMGGKKKISDYLVDNKVPVNEKSEIWVLASGNNIVWLVGHRIDDRYKITPQTKNCFLVALKG